MGCISAGAPLKTPGDPAHRAQTQQTVSQSTCASFPKHIWGFSLIWVISPMVAEAPHSKSQVQLRSNEGNGLCPGGWFTPTKAEMPTQGQGWRSLGFGKTPGCVSAQTVLGLPAQQTPLQQAKSRARSKREKRGNASSAASGVRVPTRERGGQGAGSAAREVPTAAETRGRRRQGRSYASAQLPTLFFQKRRVKTIVF